MAKADLIEMQQQKGGYDAVNTTSSSGNIDDGTKNIHHESGAYPYTTDGSTGDSTLRVSHKLPYRYHERRLTWLIAASVSSPFGNY